MLVSVSWGGLYFVRTLMNLYIYILRIYAWWTKWIFTTCMVKHGYIQQSDPCKSKKTKYFVIMVMIVPAYTGTSEAHWNTKKNFVQILILLTQGKWVPWLFGPKIHRPGCHRADLAATIPTALALLIPRRWLRLRSMSHHASCSSLSNSTQPRWANIIGSLGSGFLFIHGEIYHIYNTTRFLSLSNCPFSFTLLLYCIIESNSYSH